MSEVDLLPYQAVNFFSGITQIAIYELNKRKMTPNERFAYKRTLAINAEAIRVVYAQVQKARSESKTRKGSQNAKSGEIDRS